MSSKVTINVTDDALSYLTDPRIFEIKHAVIEEMVDSFSQLIEELKETAEVRQFPFPAGTDVEVGKISRGENYRNQPYVVCDFPRLFSKTDVFAFRVIFWWGHYFLLNLHIAGKSLQRYWPAIRDHISELSGEYWVSNGKEEWEHAVDPENFTRIKDIKLDELKEQCEKAGFLKIVHTIPLQDLQKVPGEAHRFLKKLLKNL